MKKHTLIESHTFDKFVTKSCRQLVRFGVASFWRKRETSVQLNKSTTMSAWASKSKSKIKKTKTRLVKAPTTRLKIQTLKTRKNPLTLSLVVKAQRKHPKMRSCPVKKPHCNKSRIAAKTSFSNWDVRQQWPSRFSQTVDRLGHNSWSLLTTERDANCIKGIMPTWWSLRRSKSLKSRRDWLNRSLSSNSNKLRCVSRSK